MSPWGSGIPHFNESSFARGGGTWSPGDQEPFGSPAVLCMPVGGWEDGAGLLPPWAGARSPPGLPVSRGAGERAQASPLPRAVP